MAHVFECKKSKDPIEIVQAINDRKSQAAEIKSAVAATAAEAMSAGWEDDDEDDVGGGSASSPKCLLFRVYDQDFSPDFAKKNTDCRRPISRTVAVGVIGVFHVQYLGYAAVPDIQGEKVVEDAIAAVKEALDKAGAEFAAKKAMAPQKSVVCGLHHVSVSFLAHRKTVYLIIRAALTISSADHRSPRCLLLAQVRLLWPACKTLLNV